MSASFDDLPRPIRRKLEKDRDTAKQLIFKAYAKLAKATPKLYGDNPRPRAMALAAVANLKRAVKLDSMAMTGFGVALLPLTAPDSPPEAKQSARIRLQGRSDETLTDSENVAA